MEGLIQAYMGYNERLYRNEYSKLLREGKTTAKYEHAARVFAFAAIQVDSPKRRLEIYCNWNGLIGYAAVLFQIATDAIEIPEKL